MSLHAIRRVGWEWLTSVLGPRLFELVLRDLGVFLSCQSGLLQAKLTHFHVILTCGNKSHLQCNASGQAVHKRLFEMYLLGGVMARSPGEVPSASLSRHLGSGHTTIHVACPSGWPEQGGETAHGSIDGGCPQPMSAPSLHMCQLTTESGKKSL